MKLEIPENVKKYELGSSIVWFDGKILYSTPKPGPLETRTMEQIHADMNIIRELIGYKKVCFILESNPKSPPPAKQERDFIADQIESVTKAMAIITSSPLSRMIANLFFGFRAPSYPVKMFTDIKAAKEWIQEYCND